MKVVRFAHLFLAVTALVWGITSGGFATDLSVETVAEEQYAWLVSTEAQAEQSLDRAYLAFDSSLIAGDVLTVASPWLRVFKVGGQWQSLAPESGPEWLAARTAWHVPQEENAALCLILDRAFLGQAELDLQIEYFDGLGELFVDLVSESEEVIASSSDFGNLLEGTGEVVVKAMNIPLAEYPEARGVYLRGKGGADGLFVLGAAVLVTRSGSVVVEDVPEDSASGRAGPGGPVVGRARPPWPAVASERRGPAEPVVSSSLRAKSGAGLRHKPVSAQTIPEFVQALMADTYFQITRDVLSAGGGFRSSPLFILEDTFGQSSAIGFSSDGAFRLQAGYQQAEAEQIVFRNVSVLPGPFQAQQRRFNPGLGEAAIFSYVLSTEAREVTVRVVDPDGVVVCTLVAQAQQNRGLHTVAWDGRDNNGDLVTGNRRYTFTLSAINDDGIATNYVPANVNTVRIEVDNDIAVISAVNDQPDPFFPPTPNSRISYTTTVPVGTTNLNIRVDIFTNNLTGLPVWSMDFNNQAVGNNSVDWGGTNGTTGQDVPDGLYVYSVRHDGGPGDNSANRQTGTIRLVRQNTEEAQSADGLVALRHAGQAAITITPVSPGAVGGALYAIRTADPSLILQSLLYQATPSAAAFTPPALMTFRYSQAIIGDIAAKLEIRRFNETTLTWERVARQFMDYANNQVVAEIDVLSLYALFAVERPPLPPILAATVRLEPEVLKVNPGILTAFVSLQEGYPISGIISAICDGAPPERMMPSAAGGSASGGNDDQTEMIMKFRRQAIEAALAEQGEALDTHFVVEGTWQGPEGTIPFVGEDDIARIIH